GYHWRGWGEARVFLESAEVTTDARGTGVFDVAYRPVPGDPVITATATDPEGNTSELSTAARPTTIDAASQVLTIPAGQPLIFSAGAGTGLSISSADAGPLPFVLSLSVSAGTLSLAGLAGLTGTGDGTASL